MIESNVKVKEDGTKEWYLNGKLHREDGPAIEYADGYKAWYLNGKRHREDGPAVEWPDGTQFWYLNGVRHRVDGPAIESANGYKSWYLNGEKMTKVEYQVATQEAILTMDQVARLVGVPVERLKIRK